MTRLQTLPGYLLIDMPANYQAIYQLTSSLNVEAVINTYFEVALFASAICVLPCAPNIHSSDLSQTGV